MASSEGPEISDIVHFEGCSHKVFPLTRSISPFQDIVAIFKLWKWLRQEKFNIVHSHTPKAGLVTMLASFLAGTKIRLHTVAGLPWMESRGIKRFILKNIDRLIYSFATKVYPNSFQLKDFMIQERLVNRRKLKVLGNGSSNGLDLDYFNPEAVSVTADQVRKHYEISDDALVFLFVGRVVRDKGINELYRAFKKITMDCHLLIVGPLEQDLDPIDDSIIDDIQKSSNMHLLGYQNDVRPYYKIANVLVFPSYREGFPNVPLQAGAMGLPCIVTNINGCNEIIEDRKNGLIIPSKDDEALYSAMLELYYNRDLLRSMANNARPMVSERFDQLKLWEEIYQEYVQLNAHV